MDSKRDINSVWTERGGIRVSVRRSEGSEPTAVHGSNERGAAYPAVNIESVRLPTVERILGLAGADLHGRVTAAGDSDSC